MTDGPLIVQSDKTLLLEVDHALVRRRAGTRSPRSPSSNAHLSTSTPTGSPRSASGTPGPPVTTPSRWSTRCCGTAATPSRTPCSSTSPRRWPATDACSCTSHPTHGLVLHTTDRPVLEEVLRVEEDPAARRGADRPGHRRRAPVRARATSSRCCSSSAGRPRTSPGTSTARRTPIALDESDWHLRDYQRQAAENFFHGGSGVVVLPCGAGKTIVGAAAMAMAQATTLILVTNTVAARQWRDELLHRTA